MMKRIIVKIGSSVIAPQGNLDKSLIEKLVKDVVAVERGGYQVILVSSGAIACGLNRLGQRKRPQDTYSLMAISSLGQIILMDVFNEKFKKHKRMCAQILLTWDDFDTRRRFMNVRKTLDKLLAMNIIPIINENDAVSYEEIRLGDNDCISARLADLSEAEYLIMLSDVEGLLKGQELVREVERIDSEIVALAKKEDKTYTSGGMLTKLEAARIATASGIKTIIARGDTQRVISRIVGGERIGTLFVASRKLDKARKRWILFSKKVKGKVFIDKGAREAILYKGKSLLGVGIINVEGIFKSGDCVSVVDAQGMLLGYGVINYNSEDLGAVKQKKFEKEVIHRDNFVKTSQGEGYCGPCGDL
ncbi:MAG: glutamate 5-kinase [Candidatus Omnitrophota bacterium]|nr:MAG: glutamate 5-kinase [Candidatus Omnitrophota bacterium]